KDASSIVLLKPYAEYFEDYTRKLAELRELCAPGEIPVGEEARRQFISVFGDILRLRNILVSFDDFAGDDVITERDLQDYQSVYLELWNQHRAEQKADKEVINVDLLFDIELLTQAELNVDYTLMRGEQRRAAKGDTEAKELRATSDRAVDSSPTLRSKPGLIEEFVDSITVNAHVSDA